MVAEVVWTNKADVSDAGTVFGVKRNLSVASETDKRESVCHDFDNLACKLRLIAHSNEQTVL